MSAGLLRAPLRYLDSDAQLATAGPEPTSDLDCVPPAGAGFGVVEDPEHSLCSGSRASPQHLLLGPDLLAKREPVSSVFKSGGYISPLDALWAFQEVLVSRASFKVEMHAQLFEASIAIEFSI